MIRLCIQLLTTIVLVEIVPVNKAKVKKIRIFLEKRYQFSMDWMQLVKCLLVNWQILSLRWNLTEDFLNKVERRDDSLDGRVVIWRTAWKRRYEFKNALDLFLIIVSLCSAVSQLKTKHFAKLITVNLIIKFNQVIFDFKAFVNNQRRNEHIETEPNTRNNTFFINFYLNVSIVWFWVRPQ